MSSISEASAAPLGGIGMLDALFQDLHADEIGMRGAGIGDRHQRAVEGDDRDVAGGGQNPIAAEPRRGDDQAHRDKGGEYLRANGVFRHHVPAAGTLAPDSRRPAFMPA